MNLYLMRHGDAVQNASSDFQRELSARGVEEVCSQARKLKQIEIQLIASSPLVRARQTAEIVCDSQNLATNFLEWIELIPSGEPDLVRKQLEEIAELNVLIVSHQPLVSRLVEYLQMIT